MCARARRGSIPRLLADGARAPDSFPRSFLIFLKIVHPRRSHLSLPHRIFTLNSGRKQNIRFELRRAHAMRKCISACAKRVCLRCSNNKTFLPPRSYPIRPPPANGFPIFRYVLSRAITTRFASRLTVTATFTFSHSRHSLPRAKKKKSEGSRRRKIKGHDEQDEAKKWKSTRRPGADSA